MRAATIRQCVVLAGGLATRPCGDRPFLAWLLRECMRFGVEQFLLLSGPLSEPMRESLAATLPRTVAIAIGETPASAGTGGALLAARDRLDERFLLCDGERLFDGNLAPLLADAAADADGVIGRDMAVHRTETSVAHAGIGVFGRSLLDHLAPGNSVELARSGLAGRGLLRATVAAGARFDIGLPEGLAWARREPPARLHRPALFLDRDGVLNVDHGWVGTRERFDWIEGAIEAVRQATMRGWHVFVVTNQSGVARGYFDEAAVGDLMRWMGEQLRAAGGTLDDWRCCPFHPEATVERYRRDSDWRKPAPGMLLDLIRAWELDPARAVMIGDSERDLQAAAAAGIRGLRFPGGNLAAFVAAAMA